MDSDGQRASKLIYALLLAALSGALVFTLVKGGPGPAAQPVEARVGERARPIIVEALRRARSHGDLETAAWLEEVLRTQDAQRGSNARQVASPGF